MVSPELPTITSKMTVDVGAVEEWGIGGGGDRTSIGGVSNSLGLFTLNILWLVWYNPLHILNQPSHGQIAIK
jgi:hypothetical protein